MNYIDLTLTKLPKENGKKTTHTIDKAIDDAKAHNKLVVLLGSPGSGKTALLKKYHDEHSDDTILWSVKEFLNLPTKSKTDGKIILLDGLDEYRSVTDDKFFVAIKLGHAINERIANATVVISCRELDWYGPKDTEALEKHIKRKVALFSINLLDKTQKEKLAGAFNVEQPDDFISEFSRHGFLENPLHFRMLAEIWQAQNKQNKAELPTTKTDLYKRFIKNAREQNEERLQNEQNQLEPEDMLKYAGYLAFYYIFTDIELNFASIDQICDSEHGYPKDKLIIAFKSSLFSDGKFIHRTIAEFASAHFLYRHKFRKRIESGVSLNRIKELFIQNERIPTALRATYAWLCSLSKSLELIAEDPYYQLLYGDNALFDVKLKENILKAVKRYAQEKTPYFVSYDDWKYLTDFYETALDDTLIQEFESALDMNNNYIWFINSIIDTARQVSSEITKYAKGVLKNPKIATHHKRDWVRCVKDDTEFLKGILDRIARKELEDKNHLLASDLLYILYPQHVTPKEVVKYLNFDGEIGGVFHYLYKTPYEDKHDLIDAIHQKLPNQKRVGKIDLRGVDIEMFVSNYFMETLLKYEQGLSAKKIYNIIKHFHIYYDEYTHISFHSNRFEDEEKSSQEKLQRLINKLFSYYINDELRKQETDTSPVYDFQYFFYYYDYNIQPNWSEILLSKITGDRTLEKKKMLFQEAFPFARQNKRDWQRVKRLAKKHGELGEILHNYLHPPKSSRTEKIEKRREQEEEKQKQVIEKNEQHFAERSDEEIAHSFNDLHTIAMRLFLSRGQPPPSNERARRNDPLPLTERTFERLKGILKETIHANAHFDDDPSLLTIKSLAEDAPGALRNVDVVCYVSTALHNWESAKLIENEFYDYLYINAKMKQRVSDVFPSNFVEQMERQHPERALRALVKFIELVCKKYAPKKADVLLSYIKSTDAETDTAASIKRMAEISRHFGASDIDIAHELTYQIVRTYAFSITVNDLKTIASQEMNEKTKQIVDALQAIADEDRGAFDVNKAIALNTLWVGGRDTAVLSAISSDQKVRIIDYMLDQFNTPQSVAPFNGWQGEKEMCALFLRNYALHMLNSAELRKLQDARKGERDIWTNPIASELNNKLQQKIDSYPRPLQIERAKDFILSDAIVSREDFFVDICDKLTGIGNDLMENRDNERNGFYNEDGTSKKEPACRDYLCTLLRYRFGYDLDIGHDLDITREKPEGDNKADFNIRYRGNRDYEVQVECKRDSNRELKKGITNQLIKKYLLNDPQRYGIYLVFDFSGKVDLALLRGAVPQKYKNSVKIIILDLKKK